MVEHVIDVSSELELRPLGKCEVLRQRSVGAKVMRPTQAVISVVSNRVDPRISKSIAARETGDTGVSCVGHWSEVLDIVA